MRGTKKVSVSTSSTARPTLLSLPEEVLETIVDKLCRISWFGDNNKVDMALSCKALLPILSMGHVEMTSPDEVHGERLLLQLTRRLMKQPDKVTHLELRGVEEFLETRRLIELSLLQNLRKLSLGEVAISLAALQPVATRLQQLCIRESRLQGGADGFLNTGWTALTSLTLSSCRMEDQALPAPNLPALEAADIHELHHRGGMLQLHELNGGCPQLTRLACELDSSLLQASEGVRRCSLLNLSRLAHLRVMLWSHTSNLSFDLPASLTSLSFSGTLNDGQHGVDFFWALRVAVKCIREGAQLQTLVCGYAEANLQTVQGGVTLDEQSRLLGWQLSGLKELEVWGSKVELLGALIAVASSMPSLLRLVVGIKAFIAWKYHRSRAPALKALL